MARTITVHSGGIRLLDKFISINWILLFLVTCVACVGFTALYSAGGGNFNPWASKQIMRFVVGLIAAIIIALIDIKFWYRMTWPIYLVGFAMLVGVEVMGQMGMGAQRWINLGFMQLQPSELMKIAVVMALAKYFHSATIEDMRRLTFLVIPSFIILAPVGLVLLQPDLGTSLMIIMSGIAMFFIAGASIWLFIGGGVLAAASIPIAWSFMHEYQKKRVRTFLDPESDPLGSGYHITQSKIALGSGGMEGKGFLQGTQSHLNFLPEKQTDFIFTLWAEEWGFIGGVALLCLFALIFFHGLWIGFSVKHNFGRYLAVGLMINFSLYIFINIGMVMGLMPVVGAPLPLISYGGTSMLAALISFGLMISAYVHKDSRVNRF
ncbi:rod shape-determining protein RodA [Alphaproteobacteria bacterium]|nr:rod shape-determining protein RodA [Alphaproteobacteria bacterium]